MEPLSNWLVDSFYFTVPGFVYFIAIFILLNWYVNFNLLDFLKSHKKYFSYFLVLIIVASYIIGVVAIFTTQRFITWIFPDFLIIAPGLKCKSSEFLDNFKSARQDFLMLRHLILSFFVLSIALIIHYRGKNTDKAKIRYIIVWVVMLIILVLAYFFQRDVTLMLQK
jgi:hypothetical protein